ncbi:hypothetical protein [Pseudomonas sp. COR18]|uniref:hypothetical protein n=1 Tax=Pseudomonas sp. COR18 TaxID=3399680 RepID=UPI003B006120
MVDPITVGAGAAVTAYLSKDGVSKLLGPTAEYLGGELKNFVAKSQENLGKIFAKAEEKAGSKLDTDGTVNSRVLKHVLDEGRFSEDELFAEYFGGVLASARTEDGKDDRGVYYSGIIQSMSVYQLRFHYFFYNLMWGLVKGKSVDLNNYDGRFSLDLIVPCEVYERTFDAMPSDAEMGIIGHALAGLSRLNLIEDNWKFATPSLLNKEHIQVLTSSFFITPSIPGLELFLWAHGRGEKGLSEFMALDLVGRDELNIQQKHLARFKTPEEFAATQRGRSIRD